jgi:hypothetical protein
VIADKAEALMCATGEKSPMVDIGQDLAARARFDPKAAERAKPGLGRGHKLTFEVWFIAAARTLPCVDPVWEKVWGRGLKHLVTCEVLRLGPEKRKPPFAQEHSRGKLLHRE